MALAYAKRISNDVRAVTIVTDPAMHERLERRWQRFPELTAGVTYELIDYDFRDILQPLVAYIERVNSEEFPGRVVTVVVPEFLPQSLWARLLHNQTANILRSRLRGQDDLVVIDVPYHIDAHVDEVLVGDAQGLADNSVP
jgi:hypothetical protein